MPQLAKKDTRVAHGAIAEGKTSGTIQVRDMAVGVQPAIGVTLHTPADVRRAVFNFINNRREILMNIRLVSNRDSEFFEASMEIGQQPSVEFPVLGNRVYQVEIVPPLASGTYVRVDYH